MLLNEWQLWVHPYPTMIKKKGRRVNPSLHPFTRVYLDKKSMVDISVLFEGKRKTSPQLKRCVRAVADKEMEGKDRSDRGQMRAAMSKGFAICTAQLQKGGYLKLGTNKPTKSGGKTGRSKAAQKGHSEKVSDYERMLAVARGE